MDDLSMAMRMVTRLFGGSYPIRLGVAAVIGVATKFVVQILSVNFDHSVTLRFISSTGILVYFAIAAVFCFAPIAFGRGRTPELTSRHIATVDEMLGRGEFSRVQKQMMWRALLEKYIEAIGPDLSADVQIERLAQDFENKQNTGTFT